MGSSTWILSRPASVYAARDFEDGRALYDRESGATQLLAPLAGFVIDRLSACAPGACSGEQLLQALLDEEALTEPRAQAEAAALLDAALATLAAAGLVARLQ